ncbi:MAG TPA: tRNA (adenosine(37)-N6)-dimethylallyltransferase MiaA [Myxococcaceae bacterium]
MTEAPPDALLVIAGPTASGKSRLALEVAEREGGEIVSADSQQIYRHFDVGTAKPTADELRRVPHHLISSVEPGEQVNAGRFRDLADAAIAQVRARGRRPIVAGGTGLYLRVLLHGVMPGPGASPAIRARIKAEAAEQGREAIHRKLAEVDPESAARILPRDLVRVERALELYELTGVPASVMRRAHGFQERRHPFRMVVLDPPREALYAAIDARVRSMFQELGLVEEVRALMEKGYRDAPPMRSVGYVQALAVAEGRMGLEEAIEDAARQTRHYAKRQVTWFKKEPGAELLRPPYAVA